MLDAPQVIETAPQLTAGIRLCVAWAEMRKVMGPGLSELKAAVAAQGIATTGPWFDHHFRWPTDTFDFEICLPVAAQVKPVGRVKAGQLPAATVARTIYHGNYDGLGAAWGEFEAWILAKGYKTGPDFWQCYVPGPESNADPATWRTELNQPLIAIKAG
ncbi:MAG: GyrI-like domain-containing protein [Methylocella sp.]